MNAPYPNLKPYLLGGATPGSTESCDPQYPACPANCAECI